MLLLATLSLLCALSMSDPVNFCREAKDCQSCASSYTHVLGFREHCSKSSFHLRGILLGFNCKRKRYTDELGRSLYAFILSLRDTNVTACLLNVRPDVSHIRTFTVECDSSGNTCTSMVAVSEEAKSIYLVFRDTTSRQQ
ncbi:hypothetical protein OSTOST_00098, partial [Ostertagia ostertagi]